MDKATAIQEKDLAESTLRRRICWVQADQAAVDKATSIRTHCQQRAPHHRDQDLEKGVAADQAAVDKATSIRPSVKVIATKTETVKVKTAQMNDGEGKLASGTENFGVQS